MKRLILSLVVGGFLLSCTGIVYSVENSGRENQIEEEIAQVWSETISEYTARIIYVLEKMQKNIYHYLYQKLVEMFLLFGMQEKELEMLELLMCRSE